MYIQCTKALLDKLKIEKSELLPAESCEDGAEGFYSWHAHFITINRREAVVCMNNLTRYTIVLYRAKVKDMMELESRIQEGIVVKIMIIRKRECFEPFVKCVICQSQNGIEYSK